MTVSHRYLFWGLLLILFALCLFLVRDILFPFVTGMALAYLLDPLVDRLEDRGLSRTSATASLIALFILTLTLAGFLVVPLILEQMIHLVSRIPVWANTLSNFMNLSTDSDRLYKILGIGSDQKSLITPAYVTEIQGQIQALAERVIASLGSIIERLWTSSLAVVNILGLTVITPVVTFYLLRDWDTMVALIDTFLPQQSAETIRAQLREMESVLSGFIRGQALLCVCLGGFYAVTLSLAGLDFAILIGISAGLLSFIPYVGTLAGLVSSVGMACIQWWGIAPWLIVIVAVIFVVGQMLEGFVLTPRLVGDRVGLHPVWVMFAVLAGGQLFGFTGVLLAVPVAAVMAVLVRFSLKAYLKSSFFREDVYDP